MVVSKLVEEMMFTILYIIPFNLNFRGNCYPKRKLLIFTIKKIILYIHYNFSFGASQKI